MRSFKGLVFLGFAPSDGVFGDNGVVGVTGTAVGGVKDSRQETGSFGHT